MLRRLLLIAVTIAAFAPVVPAQRIGTYRRGDTLTGNPRAYAAYIRREIHEDLVDLYRTANEMLAAMNETDRKAMKRVAKNPEKVVKLSRNLWGNVQARRPTRERPKTPVALSPRSLAEARTDTEAVRLLIRSVAEDLNEQYRSREINATEVVQTIEKIERLELLGYQLRVDLAGYR